MLPVGAESMTVANSSNRRSGRKPQKPRKPRRDFPLFPHACGQWAKKVRGKLHYFGVWGDPEAAERLWDETKDQLKSGRITRVLRDSDGVMLREACNQFLTSKKLAVEANELSSRQFDDLFRACDHAIDCFGKDRLIDDILPEDFRQLKASLVARYKSPSSLRREMSNVRSIFFFAERNDLTDKRVKFGDDFRPPGRKAIKRQRNEQKADQGERLFTPHQILDLVEAANPAMRAMILLAANVGCGNSDVKALRFGHLNLQTGRIDYPRAKTGCDRRAKLWQETTDVIKAYLDRRPEPADEQYSNFVFITKYRKPWGTTETKNCPVTREFRKLLDRLEIYRPGLSFYALRHTYRTIADATLDQPAVDLTMGHSRDDMASIYRERIDDERLERVADHVHAWLFESGGKPR